MLGTARFPLMRCKVVRGAVLVFEKVTIASSSPLRKVTCEQTGMIAVSISMRFRTAALITFGETRESLLPSSQRLVQSSNARQFARVINVLGEMDKFFLVFTPCLRGPTVLADESLPGKEVSSVASWPRVYLHGTCSAS